MSDSDKQVVQDDQKEVITHTLVQQPQDHIYQTGSGQNFKASGSRKTVLWIITALSVLLLGTIVGGAVGGPLAVQHTKNQCSQNAPSSSPNSNATNVTSSGAIINLTPWNGVKLPDVCGTEGKNYTSSVGKTFLCIDNQGYEGGDIDGAWWATTIEMCVDLCAARAKCKGATFSKQLAAAWKDGNRNCWLKKTLSLNDNGTDGAWFDEVSNNLATLTRQA